jgi:O-methyltransferase
MKSIINKLLIGFGYQIQKKSGLVSSDGIPVDFKSPEFDSIYNQVKGKTYTSPEAVFSLISSVEYVIRNNIKGDFVECGVWKGGSAMVMAMALQSLGKSDRKLYLYDTFEGMSEPTEKDVDFRVDKAGKLLSEQEKNDSKNVWCYSPLEEVKENLAKTGYPEENIVLVKGKVEDTIPHQIPSSIALLRLDTDWFESTYHEMKYLYPLLEPEGVLILDDYGHWKGAREAVDKYFLEKGNKPLLHRVNYTVRSAIKPRL